MYSLFIHKNVVNFIRSRSHREKSLIYEKLNLLKENPYNHSELDIKKLVGEVGLYRLRIRRYRFIYNINEDNLLILLMVASSRGDVYKKI
jgi:mRNA interferase RelE/StbE